jgi:hypothetical protein
MALTPATAEITGSLLSCTLDIGAEVLNALPQEPIPHLCCKGEAKEGLSTLVKIPKSVPNLN